MVGPKTRLFLVTDVQPHPCFEADAMGTSSRNHEAHRDEFVPTIQLKYVQFFHRTPQSWAFEQFAHAGGSEWFRA